jgi:hypothetical protein
MVHVIVHPIDCNTHPTIPPGFRWSVEFGGHCLNAGWEPSRPSAAMAGEAAGVCAVRAAQMCGADVSLKTVHLEHDPIPASDADVLTVMES